MGYWFHKYPGTNFHEQNIDWITESIGALKEEFKNFKEVNQIKYAGAWDITKQYPIWSIVSDNNMGYLALQNVPSGITLSDGNYWVEIADYSAVLAGISTRVTALENDVDDLTDRVNVIAPEWKDHKVLWVGDSYGVGSGNPYEVAQNLLGCQGTNISQVSCRFGTTGNAEHHFLYLIQDYVANHSDMNTYTDVIICGGANDIIWNPSEDLNDVTNPYSIVNTVSYVRSHFPNAKIRIGMVARLINSGATNCTAANFRSIKDQYYEGASKNGVEYIAGSELINHNYLNRSTDGVHLSGGQTMGTNLAELLLSGNFNRNFSYGTLFYDTSDVDFAPNALTFHGQTWFGSTIQVNFHYLYFNFGSATTIVHDQLYSFVQIGGMTNIRNFFAATDKMYKIRTTANVKLDDNSIVYLPATIACYNNKLWFALNYSAAADISNIIEIHFPMGFELILDEAYC